MSRPSRPTQPVRYPTSYIRELSPAWLRYVAAGARCDAPDLQAPFRYLELGCGTGLSTLLHAAAYPGARFHACEADAACVEQMRRSMKALRIGNLHVHHAPFSALAGAALPAMDFIVLHGVYTWIGEVERQAVLQLLHDRLRPGGLAYVSYNCLPGWAAELPLQRLVRELAAIHSGDDGTRAMAGVMALQRLTTPAAPILQAQPGIIAAAEDYAGRDPAYLAHELLSGDWAPRYTTDVHDEMAAAGLRYLASATLADNHPELLFADDLQRRVGELPTARLRMLAEDVLLGRRFRRDVYVREPAAALDHAAVHRLPVGCTGTPDEIGETVRVPRGDVHFDADFISALQASLHDGPQPMKELVRRILPGAPSSPEPTASRAGAGDASAQRLQRNLIYLIAGGALRPFNRAAGRLRISPAAQQLLHGIAQSTSAGWVPSRSVGGGVRVLPVQARRLIAKQRRAESQDAAMPELELFL